MPMTEQEIFTSFCQLVEEYTGVPAGEVAPGADLTEDLEIDSLSMVELIAAAQETFGVDIPDEAFKYLKTVQDVVSYVQRAQRSSVSA
jgi:acyl carrier protein